MAVNESKTRDMRMWEKWRASGAIGTFGSAEKRLGLEKLQLVAAFGDPFLKASQIHEAVAGVQRALSRQPEFLEALAKQGKNGIPITHRERWHVAFDIGKTLYVVDGDGQFADELRMERIELKRVEGSSISGGTFCEIPAYEGEDAHIFPTAEVYVPGREFYDIPALAVMDRAFPELGLVWH